MKKSTILWLCLGMSQIPMAQAAEIQATDILASKTKSINGEMYTFLKLRDKSGATKEVVLNQKNELIEPQAIFPAKKSKIGADLARALATGNTALAGEESLAIIFALNEKVLPSKEKPQSGGFSVQNGVTTSLDYQGLALDEAAAKKLNQQNSDSQKQALANKKEARRVLLATLGQHNGWKNHPALSSEQALEHGSVSMTMKRKDIVAFVEKNADLIAGIELALVPANGLDSAMRSTNVDPYALNYSARGNNVGIYMSEGECPNETHITSYTRLGTSTTSDSHDENVSAIVRGVAPLAWLYCRSGYQLASSTDLQGTTGHPAVQIETHSWGYFHSSTESEHDDFKIYDRDADNQSYDKQSTVFFIAGNAGKFGGNHVTSPGKGLNVVTVGNYDDSNDTINPDSCFADPETKNQKPEISAPGTNICAGGVGCWTGTSQATPHAAAFAADLVSSYTWLQRKPYMLKALMLASATKPITGGVDAVGLGGIDFYRAFYNGAAQWWEGANNSFDYFDSQDAYPNNGAIDRVVTLDANKTVSVALSWLNSGSYTYDHRADAHPIGMDLDITVYAPNGNAIASSASWDNAFEVVRFNTGASAGNYRVAIRRYANRDTAAKLHMGLMVISN